MADNKVSKDWKTSRMTQLRSPSDWSAWERDLKLALQCDGSIKFIEDENHSFEPLPLPGTMTRREVDEIVSTGTGGNLMTHDAAIKYITRNDEKKEKFERKMYNAKSLLLYTIDSRYQDCLDSSNSVYKMFND